MGPLRETHVFSSFTFSCLYFITFYRHFQTQITPALCHTSSLSLIHSCHCAEVSRKREVAFFSCEWLRNPLAPTSNQPPKSVISPFLTSLASVSPFLLPLALLWFEPRLPLVWAAAAETAYSCNPYLQLLPLHPPKIPPHKQSSLCLHQSPAHKPLGAAQVQP